MSDMQKRGYVVLAKADKPEDLLTLGDVIVVIDDPSLWEVFRGNSDDPGYVVLTGIKPEGDNIVQVIDDGNDFKLVAKVTSIVTLYGGKFARLVEFDNDQNHVAVEITVNDRRFFVVFTDASKNREDLEQIIAKDAVLVK